MTVGQYLQRMRREVKARKDNRNNIVCRIQVNVVMPNDVEEGERADVADGRQRRQRCTTRTATNTALHVC